MDISIPGTTALLLMALIFVGVIAFIFVMRSIINKKSMSNLTEKYRDKVWKSPVEASNKYPDVNAFRFSRSMLYLGVVLSLMFCLFAFSWTNFEKEVFIPDGALDYEEEIEIEPPRTAEPPPPPPPPPPPVIEEVPEEEIEEEDEPEFVDQDVEEETVIEEPVVEEEAPPPPPPPPPPEPEVEEIFKVVEQMPRFPGCENMSGTDAEKKACADKAMLKYIYGKVKYPAIARENGLEGMVIVQFVVDKSGNVTEAKVVRDQVGGGCAEVALKAVKSMNNMPQKWTPGKQRGRPVKVLYTLPVKFKLEG